MKTIFKIFILIIFGHKAYSQIELVAKVNTNGLNPYSVTISNDNKYVYVGGMSVIQIYERNNLTGSLNFITTIDNINGSQGSFLYSSVISPDSNFLYISMDKYIAVFQRNKITGGLSKIEVIDCPNSPATLPTTSSGLIISKDNRHLYSSQRDFIYHFDRDLQSGKLIIVDTIEKVNYFSGWSYDVSIELNPSNEYLYATGLNSISVYKRDTLSGRLQLYQRVNANDNFQYASIANNTESKISKNGKYLYTVSSSNGITVSMIDTISDSITFMQSVQYSSLPKSKYLSILPNGKGLCLSSEKEMVFYKIDSLTDSLKHIKTYFKSSYYDQSKGGRKVFDNSGRFMYTVPFFTDTIFIYKLTRPQFDYPNDSLPLLSINKNKNKIPFAQLFPNPTNGELLVDLSNNYKEGKIIVRNAFGQIVQSTSFNQTNRIHTNIEGSPGFYCVEVYTSTDKIVFKVIKI